MPLSQAQQRKLARMAANNSLEVEHLLKVATIGDASDAPFLRSLCEKHSWSTTGWEGTTRVAPFGRWTEIVCRFLEEGYQGVVNLAADSTNWHYCLGLLESIKSRQSVLSLLSIGGETIDQPGANIDEARTLAASFNLLLSFKVAAVIEPDVELRIRTFLHRLLEVDDEMSTRIAVCALRGVGDETSLKLIAALPPFQGDWKGLEATASSQIRMRLSRRK